MKKLILPISILFFLLTIGCQEETNRTTYPNPNPNPGDGNSGGDGNNNQNSEWLIPEGEVRDGGPGKDGIPSIDSPRFAKASTIMDLATNDLVLGIVDSNGNKKAYPHNILDWHEIVNDKNGEGFVSVIYCPLTGTGTLWNRSLNGGVTTFGVSGLLYNSNIIPYDRNSNSNWSQMLLKSVNGSLRGTDSRNFKIIETRWGTWRSMFPDSDVLTRETGYSRNYDFYPYGNYKTNHSYLLFPVSNRDSRMQNKERVLGIVIDGEAYAYSFNNFKTQTNVIQNTHNGQSLVICGNEANNFIVAYKSHVEGGEELTFTAVQDALPVIMIDNEGTTWDIFGRGVSGPQAGAELEMIDSFMGYWFAWAAFYPSLTLDGN